ncbi:MAG: hypothetical protein HQ509_10570 [Candidatus Marinimicrobia bacterium]|nr:hypothetical protein [Candidatus Neomarinimicrobiota bacterium]
MDIILVITGPIAILFGILLLFFPKLLIKLSEYSNQVVTSKDDSMKNRYVIGGILTVSGLFLLYQSFIIHV